MAAQPRKAPLARAHEEPEEESPRQRAQQGWKDPGVFTLRVKARDLPTAHGTVPSFTSSAPTVLTHSAAPTWTSLLFSEHTCLRAFALAVSQDAETSPPSEAFLDASIDNFKAPLPPLFFSQCNHFPTHNSLILFLICLTYVSSVDSTLVTAAPQGPAHA